MPQAMKEEQEVWDWLQDQNLTKVMEKTGVTMSRLHYFRSGKAKYASFQVVREIMILKEKMEAK